MNLPTTEFGRLLRRLRKPLSQRGLSINAILAMEGHDFDPPAGLVAGWTSYLSRLETGQFSPAQAEPERLLSIALALGLRDDALEQYWAACGGYPEPALRRAEARARALLENVARMEELTRAVPLGEGGGAVRGERREMSSDANVLPFGHQTVPKTIPIKESAVTVAQAKERPL